MFGCRQLGTAGAVSHPAVSFGAKHFGADSFGVTLIECNVNRQMHISTYFYFIVIMPIFMYSLKITCGFW